MIFWELFSTFFVIGAFTFGGGYAMLPLIQEQVVARGWMDTESVVNFVAIAESTPGPFAVNMATFVGSKMGGVLGAICATVGIVLPSFVIILIVAGIYEAFRKSTVVSGCMRGLKSAVIALLAGAVVSVAATVFFPEGLRLTEFTTPQFYVSAGIFLIMLFLAFRKKHPILVVCLSALLGIAAGYLGV